MSTTLDLETERFPLGSPVAVGRGDDVRPFGLSVARWDARARFDRDKVSINPVTQTGMFGDQPLRDVITAGSTTCQIESDGQTSISLDYPVDDK